MDIQQQGNFIEILFLYDDKKDDDKIELPNEHYRGTYMTIKSFMDTMAFLKWDLIILIGPTAKEMYLHFPSKYNAICFLDVKQCTKDKIEYFFLTKALCLSNLQMDSQACPLMSFITTAFQSKHRIWRPWLTIKAQSYRNWEWIVVDDNFAEDAPAFQKQLMDMTKNDPRVKYVRIQNHSGYIGEMKHFGFSIALGKWLLELDHDDEIVSELLEWILFATKDQDDVGFLYTDNVQLFENSYAPFWYGHYYGLGFGSDSKRYQKGHFQYHQHNPPINERTLTHIVGVPNHVRCWRKSLYNKLGGHNVCFSVADDYELILRSFLETKFLHIAEIAYYQYINEGHNNFTNRRNSLIQYFVQSISGHYRNAIQQRIKQLLQQLPPVNEELRIKYQHTKYDWEIPYEIFPSFEKVWHPNDQDPNNPCISIVMPTYNRPAELSRALQSILKQTYTNYQVYIVGDQCPALESFMNKLIESQTLTKEQVDKIHWWNMEDNHGSGGAVPRNYALKRLVKTNWIAYLDDDNYWKPNHLASMVECIQRNPTTNYLFSSFIVNENENNKVTCKTPIKGRMDTSCIVHKKELLIRYGYWKTRNEAGYAHDWELFSRWHLEPYTATLQYTMVYMTTFNQQSYESILALAPND